MPADQTQGVGGNFPRDQGPAKRWPARYRLLLISVASLYFELMLIRWLPTEVRILAYVSNVTLISCTLGLGLGVLLAWGARLRASSVFGLLAGMTSPRS
jgi:hypothetical protein